MNRVPYLVAQEGPLDGSRYPVTDGGLVVGREDDCDVVLTDDGVSRQHARLHLHNGSVWVHDAGSRNGVFVNDKRVVRPRTLAPGDTMTIGRQSFCLEVITVADETGTMTATTPEPTEADAPPPRGSSVVIPLVLLTATLMLMVGLGVVLILAR